MEDLARREETLNVLPREMWKDILDRLTSREDLINCSHAFALFRSILAPRIHALGFRDFWNHAVGSRMIGENDILNSRLVSHRWRDEVDHVLQSRPPRLDLSCYRSKSLCARHSFTLQTDNTPNAYGSILLKLDQLEKNSRLVSDITSNIKVKQGKSVLVGRHLVISDLFPKDFRARPASKQQFYADILKFLQSCGNHVWHLSLSSFVPENMPQWFLNTLWRWLELLPNLKMLTCQVVVSDLPRVRHCREIEELEAGIALQPFPRLPNLVTVQIDGAPEVVLKSILQTNRQVKNVEVNQYLSDSDLHMNFLPMRDTPLREICATINHVTELDTLTTTGWPLEKITLNFSKNFVSFSAMEQRLGNLRNFRETLKYLRIKTHARNPRRRHTGYQLDLPLLEVLHLHVTNHAYLDFMFPLLSLKVLKLTVLCRDNGSMPQLEMGHIVRCSLHEVDRSRIWEMLPSLEQVHVQIRFWRNGIRSAHLQAENCLNYVFHRGQRVRRRTVQEE